MTKDRSPFYPGKPVSPELFIGRGQQIELIERALRQARAGSQQYLFITGERGIGKSSLASLSRELAEKEYGFIGALALLGGADTLGEACRRIYQAIASQLPEKGLMEKIRGVFAQYVEKVNLFGIGVEFKKDDATRASLAEDFLPLLDRVGKIAEESGKSGILVIADDINGVVNDPRFANFVKSVVDQIAVGPMREFPWVFVLTGVRERMDDLKRHQPSIDRIFQPIELSLMDMDTARRFYERAFRTADHAYKDQAISLMSTLAGGHPVMWHELGDAVFWEDQDETITLDDVGRGLRVAAENVGRKYLKRKLYDELRSDVYRNILSYIGSLTPGNAINRQEALKALPKKEAANFDNFIDKMRKLELMRLGDRRGEYVFTNFLYQFYVYLRGGVERNEGLAVPQRPGRKP